jgi:hypothetical protein
MPKRNFRSTCIKPTCASSEQSRARSLGSEMASSGPASPVKTQSPEHGQKLCLGRDSVAIAKTANMVRRVVVELPKSEVATAEKIDSTVGCFPGEGSPDSWFTAVAGRGDGMSPRQSALSVSRFLPRGLKTASLGRPDILRCRAVGISASIESGIAINAAERTDLNCAEKIPLQCVAPMRPKYLRTTAMWTGPVGGGLHGQFSLKVTGTRG